MKFADKASSQHMADRLPRPAFSGVDPGRASSPSGRPSTSTAGTRRTALYPSTGIPVPHFQDLRLAESAMFNVLDGKIAEDASGVLNRYWD